MPLLELKLFGGLSLLQEGRPIPELKTHKGRALLVYLAVTRQVASRAVLAGLLWPDKPEAEAYANLRKVLFRLRPLAAHLHVTRETLAFNFEAAHTLDVADFEANLSAKTDIERLARAVGIYQGDFLDEFSLDDAPHFEAWALAQRARLRRLALAALQTLIAHFTRRAAYETAIGYARRTLSLEPWHEETHRDLMRLLALTGQRSAALAQFEACRASLAAELGVAPSAATLELYEQIKQGALEGPEAGAGRWLSGPRHNLPEPATPFFGRETELESLAARLSDPAVRLVTILGLGGMGKTRLALAAAAAQLGEDGLPPLFPHGVRFVSLARLEAPDHLVPTVAEALGLRFVAGGQPKAQLLDYLRQKAILLVLDNFEHLSGQARLVDELLGAAPRLKILVTSREKLGLQSECLLPIGGLALPPVAAETGRADYGAIQLFCERARRVRPDFSLSRENEHAVLEICRLVHAMPLGIVLAAAWLESFSPREIAAEIRQSQDFLAAEWADLPERQRSLRAAFEHSWRLLPEAERVAFQRLSVFRGGFTRIAAQTVTGVTLRDLHGLVSRSFLSVSGDGRYDVHELLREYGAEKLAGAVEGDAPLRERHSAFYCNLLYAQADLWHTSRQLEALAAVTIEAANVQRAWQWALEQGEWLRLTGAAESWGWYHDWLGLVAEGHGMFRALADRARSLAPKAQPEVYLLWVKALAWQGLFASDAASAIETFRSGLAVLNRPELAERDTRREGAFLLQLLAGAYYGRDRKTARPLLTQSLALYRACHDSWGIAATTAGLGYLDWAMGDYARALAGLKAGLALHQARGDAREIAACMEGLAWIHQHLGEFAQAIQQRGEALERYRQIGDRSAEVHALATLSASLTWHGRFAEAEQAAHHSLALCRELGGNSGAEGFARIHIALVQMLTGQYADAESEAALTLALVRAAGDHGVEATVHWLLGSLALIRADFAAARAAFAESRRLYDEVQDNYVGLVLASPGYAACLEGRTADARSHLVEALQFSLRLRDHICLLVTLPGVALYLGQVGQVERAAEIWALAQAQPHIANSRWYADVLGHRVEAMIGNRAAQAGRVARDRGRALDVWGVAQALGNEL